MSEKGHAVFAPLNDASLNNGALANARRPYQRAGFELIEEVSSHSFGQEQIEQTWARAL